MHEHPIQSDAVVHGRLKTVIASMAFAVVQRLNILKHSLMDSRQCNPFVH